LWRESLPGWCDKRLREAIHKIATAKDPGCQEIGHWLEYGFAEDVLTGQFRNWFISSPVDVKFRGANGETLSLSGGNQGTPKDWRIFLYPPAFKSVSELAATIVHEYIHILDPATNDYWARIDLPNGSPERTAQYCTTGKWPALKNPNVW
jgi:hypothetical protein